MKLTKPDKKRCQAEILHGGFMTLGRPEYRRCTNTPVVIATEVKPGKDGQQGSMSLCANCLVKFIEQLGSEFATLKPIKKATIK